MDKNSKELNKLKLRSSRIKALGKGMNFSFGTNNKSLSLKVSRNDIKWYFFEKSTKIGLFWQLLYLYPSEIEVSQYPQVTYWEFLAAAGIGPASGKYQPKESYNNKYVFISDKDNLVSFDVTEAKNDPESFKRNFKNTFGVDYDTWNSRNSCVSDTCFL
jgi:hypothetical protein